MTGFLIALSFLTRIYIPVKLDYTNENLRISYLFFPVIGIIIGSITSLALYLFGKSDPFFSAAISLVVYLLITGGLHMDGVADLADGLSSGKSGDELIRIMKDSRIGTFGVIALFIVLVLKLLLYYKLASNPVYIIISLMISKYLAIHLINNCTTPGYGGMADKMREYRLKKLEIIDFVFVCAVLAYFNIKYILVFIITILCARLFQSYTAKKIGGLTGDVLGAVQEYGEILSLIIFWGIISWKLF